MQLGIKYEERGPFWADNQWIGVSVENNKHGVSRIEHLVQTPAAIRFLSIEPLLEDLGDIRDLLREIDWCIIGGESGNGARPFDIAWARNLITQCRSCNVAPYLKQLGANVTWCGGSYSPGYWPLAESQRGNHYAVERVKLKHKKGGAPSEWPEDLRVREMPAQKESVPA